MKKLFWITVTLIGVNWQNCSEILAHEKPNNRIEKSTIISNTLKLDSVSNNSFSNNHEFPEAKARELYETGNAAAAIPLLEAAIDRYSRVGNREKQAIALRNLALVYQQLGRWEESKTTINNITKLLPQISNASARNKIFAQTLEVRGQLELSLGQSETAFITWQEAAEIHQKIGDFESFTQNKIYQAQALQTQGLYARAINTLTQVKDDLQTEPNNLLKAKALLSIGDVLRRVGRYEESELTLQESLTIAKELASLPMIADIYLSLGSNLRLQEKTQIAFNYYNKAIAISPILEQQIWGKLSQLNLLVEQNQLSKVPPLVTEIETILTRLTPSPTAIDARISLAGNLIELKPDLKIDNLVLVEHLVQAISLARDIGDKRRESNAIGNLGSLYEQEKQLAEAQELTEKALLISQTLNAPDLSYQWQWQLGRILRGKGEIQKAIAAYTKSIDNLTVLRGDLVAVSSDVQFSFRQSVEPVYRQLVDLLLQPNSQTISQTALKQARKVIESLQVAELDNFFRDACLDTKPVEIDRLDSDAAIVYTVILPDRLEVIVAVPGKPLKNYKTIIPQEELEIEITSFLSLLKLPQRGIGLKSLQTKLYNWLISPIETDLVNNQIETIVFVPDGIFRNVPPAVLSDGDRYLIEKYSVAIAPSLQLVAQKSRTTKKAELLLAGVTEARQDFEPLPAVKIEINEINTLYPGDILLNNFFTENNFNQAIEKSNYKIVHLATHGKFSSNLEETFVLTWDERININELKALISGDKQQLEPIELLVLSACETATGDNKAALGLAGIAVRAGARSTLASLWAVNDKATAILMTYFYQELQKDNITKAEAIRRAQQKILQNPEFSHPYFWSAFILVGNWQ